VGRRHGAEGIWRYTEVQTVAHQRLLPLAPSHGLDDRRYAAVMTGALKALKALRTR
jgi:succinate-semialdehyde dehydrogenase/glutarate-semialdehyde dehydrogenase